MDTDRKRRLCGLLRFVSIRVYSWTKHFLLIRGRDMKVTPQNIFEPVRNAPRRRKRHGAPAQLPAAGVLVTSVTIHSLHEIDFSFSSAVTSVGGVGNEQIVIVSGGGSNTPSSAEQVDATTVRFWFESVTAAGDAWAIAAV